MASSRCVAVLMGGWSAEREVSLVSGRAVCQALEELGHRVVALDVSRDVSAFLQALNAKPRPDVVINALHGRGGEDGTIQGLLDMAQIPYTHSGVLASALAMNKPLAKRVVSQAGVRCAEGVVMTRAALLANGYPFPPPFVLKPPDEGSSVGVRIILPTTNDVPKPASSDWPYGDREVLIERFIPGRELTVGLLGAGADVRALAVTELRPKTGFYDYDAKYSAGMTDHLLPAPVPSDVYEAALRMAETAYRALGCNGAARIDARWDDSRPGTEGLTFLEMNTQPGLTPLSLLPEQAAHVGMPFNALIAWMMDHPLCPA